ncbi:MAG: D-alanyl-D-alanine carboxypeptidase [Oscillospiraceae bacterium]|nr:D-alanyl-D-alanine carboxypeptidase [Oscillospiraceae bacterium]
MHRFKSIFSGVLCLVLLASIFPCRAKAVSTSATSAILLDAQSGRVLYEVNADREMLIASTTKIMTAVVALENCALSDTVTIRREHTLAEGSSMYLKEGEELRLETLLYGLLLASGNDAALAIADHCAGSTEKFAAMMNEKAEELGMSHTSFANPNGLDAEGHYSTARDMARLAAYAMEKEAFRRMVSTVSVTVEGRSFTNHNKLLKMLDGCVGLKTGYTRAAGRTLVSAVERAGRRLIAVTLQDGNDWLDHTALYEYGFAAFTPRKAAEKGKTAGEVRLANGAQPTLTAVYAEDFTYPLQQGESLSVKVRQSALTAPVSEGETVGEAVFYLHDEEVGAVALLAGETAQKTPHIPLVRRFFTAAAQ